MASNRLMYPLVAPRGGVGSDGPISRKSRYPTKVMDYLKFTIYESDENSNSYTYAGKGKGGGDKKDLQDSIPLFTTSTN